MSDDLQTIPARHGVATYVPAGSIIKIVNTSGTQVVDTWAFALPAPDGVKDAPKKEAPAEKKEEKKEEKATPAKKTPTKKKNAGNELPSQEDAEKTTQDMLKNGDKKEEPASGGWSSYVPTSYVPSLGFGGSSAKKEDAGDETETQKNSRTWSSYFPSGQGFSSYIPQSASDTVSAFAKDHQRDPNKSYLEQMTDFSKTPVGATGFAALTGSGYGGAAYAGYQAWNSKHAADAPAMEFLSMQHSRASTLHMTPRVDDVLLSNLREPMLMLAEDASPGVHDTIMPACDPLRYRALGVHEWAEHGSCAENLVLALKELNERAGLQGAKGVGADITVNNIPAPLNLFMNVPWDAEGDLGFKAPKTSKGDYVRLKAERDVVVVMSACPQDITDVNGKKVSDAHFIVEEDNAGEAIKRSAPKKRPAPKKMNSTTSQATQKPTPKPAAKTAAPAKKAPAASKPAASAAPAKKKPAPAPVAPSKKPAAGGATPAPKKKPAPKPVTPSTKKPAPAAAEKKEVNGTGAPAEKKKPKKLAPRPKATAAK